MLLLGIGIILIAHRIHYKYYSVFTPIFLIGAVFLLILTISKGERINEAARWLTIPGLGLSFQTSDFAKLALIMYLARTLSRKQGGIGGSNRSFFIMVFWIVVFCSLIGKENFSTAFILFVTSLVLMFIGRVKILYLAGFVFSGALLVLLAALIITNSPNKGRFETWSNRIENFINSEDTDANYQAEQSKIAIATGGFFGKGPGNSTQRNYLPYAYSDFIYAIIIEEYGLFFGAIPLLLMYLFLLYRTGVIVRKSSRTFPAFLAIGLVFSLVIQALINIAVAVNLIPVTGQTLPFVSMGGTSIIFTSISLSIVLSISRIIQENEKRIETT